MFSVGDYVQPLKGGPKLKVLEATSDVGYSVIH
jgi:uncharacterized protein YodC (DUF2158 family)